MIADWEINGVYLADMLKVRHPDLFAQLHSTLSSHGIEVRLLENVRDIWAKRTTVRFQTGPREVFVHSSDTNQATSRRIPRFVLAGKSPGSSTNSVNVGSPTSTSTAGTW